MTCAEIAARILKRIDDDPTNPGSVAADPQGGPVSKELLAGINEGQELAALLTLCLETSATITLPATTCWINIRQSVPDFLVPLRLSVNGVRLRPANLAQLDAQSDVWQLTPGTPRQYLTMGCSLGAVTPQASGDTAATLIYARCPAQMVADDFPEIPQDYHQDLVDYGIYYVRRKEGAQSLQRALGYLNRFLDRMTNLADFVRAKSRAARYDTLPFELRLFDRARLVAEISKGAKWQKVS